MINDNSGDATPSPPIGATSKRDHVLLRGSHIVPFLSASNLVHVPDLYSLPVVAELGQYVQLLSISSHYYCTIQYV